MRTAIHTGHTLAQTGLTVGHGRGHPGCRVDTEQGCELVDLDQFVTRRSAAQRTITWLSALSEVVRATIPTYLQRGTTVQVTDVYFTIAHDDGLVAELLRPTIGSANLNARQDTEEQI